MSKAAWEGHQEDTEVPALAQFPHLPYKVLLVSPAHSGSIGVMLTLRNRPMNLQSSLSWAHFLKCGLPQLTYLLWV